MLISRVFPGAALVRASLARTSALINVDFPTFDRPTIAICGSGSRGKSAALAALRDSGDGAPDDDSDSGSPAA